MDDLASLRRIVVLVAAGLFVLVTVAEVVDGFFFNNRYDAGPSFYLLIGGIFAGLGLGVGVDKLRGPK